jgi:NAD(P)-dependent dehydrogenase (short-subunit alcohol dehydrogenase family)
MQLEGKKALITGSRRGIGRAIALALAREGCDIGLNDIERDAEAERTVALIQEVGRHVSFTVADVSRADGVDRLCESFLEAHGRIDILVNNAYWALHMPFWQITEKVWDRTMDTCLKGYFLCSQQAARRMIEQGDGGAIVSIASVHASRVWPNDTVYGVAKAAVVRLTMSMALDLAGTGIRANAIAPGYIDSQPLPPEREHERGARAPDDPAIRAIPSCRIGLPDDIGQLAAFLCSPRSSYTNGACIVCDGGFLVGGTPG